MPIITNRFKLSAISAAMLAAHGFGAHAQEDSASYQEEEVVVTGIRAALQRSIDDKRAAQNIVDTVNAEDMGKTTDQNIADSLGRVTGVTVVSRDGEGSTVTVRGATANQNNITLNGQVLTSTEFSQAVDLSSYSADILSKLEVVKTPSADQDEGSLGATINLITVKPLEQRNDIRSFTAQGRYSDFSEEYNHKLQLSVSEKFFDDTFGVALTLYDETNTYRRDEYRVENFRASDTMRIARDQNGEVISDVRGITHDSTTYEMSLNENDRRGGTLGLQWIPSHSTEIMLDATYTQQETDNTNYGVRTRHQGHSNFVEGQVSIDTRGAAPFTDPQEDWYTVNTDHLTTTKFLNRFGSGDLISSTNGDEKENASATLRLEQDITDTFRLSAALGYSRSKSETKDNAYSNMQNWRNIPSFLIFDAGSAAEPVGYDCSSGRCELVHGEGMLDFGDQLYDEYDENGTLIPAYNDNSATTAFHPADIDAQHLAFISERDRTIEDTMTNFQLDFDYDLDKFGMTTIEFGGKISQREKYVDDQLFEFSSNSRSQAVIDSVTGRPVSVPGGPITDVRGNNVAVDGGLPYDDFMADLGYGRTAATSGWTPADALAAKSLVVSAEDAVRIPDNSDTRETQLDTSAVYLKTNFEFMDGRLSGDVGVRYVETEVDSKGFAGVDFWNFGEDFERHMDYITVANLRNTNLPECPAPVYADAEAPVGYEYKYQRLDGLGWDTTSGPDPSGWTRIERDPNLFDEYGYIQCHDANWAGLAATGDATTYPVWWEPMWRFADVSTSKDYAWDASNEEIVWNGEPPPPNDASGHSAPETDLDKKSFAVSATHSYSNVLPSLNLNFAFTDDLIGRFAISKTMTRPEIDLLRAGSKVTEGQYWGGVYPPTGNTVEKYNPQLQPLESKNIDVSLEWYFNDTSMVSMALFSKDMDNFTDTDVAQAYLTDVRNIDGQIALEDLLMFADDSGEANNHGLNGCMPQRTLGTVPWNVSDPNALSLSDDYRDLCGSYQVQSVINGKSAEIRGMELGYNQTYDFLPGYFLSGLGVSANYTYQDSEYEADYSTIDTTLKLPSLPVAETPEHTYNFTGFWEQDGHQVRLSYRGSSDSLVGVDYASGDLLRGRNWNGGSIWNEGRDTLDLSATYAINDNVSLTFQAINLTNESYRQYFTSRTLEVERVQDADGNVSFTAFEEGNPLEGEATKSRTYREYTVGTTYRLGLRVNF